MLRKPLQKSLTTLVLGVTLLGASPAELPPLIEAARKTDWAEVRALLQDGADPAATAPDGATALHWAAYWDDVESARLLIQAGADVNAANDLGATALFNASLNGSVVMAESLLSAGANPNAALLSGETPVMTAARTGSPEVMELLLAAGGDPNVTGTRGQTALMWTVGQRHVDAARVLVENGADIHARTESWSQVMAVPPHTGNHQSVPHGANTALMFAARVGDLASAKLLVGAGASVDDADAWGVSATTLAAHSGFDELVEFLLEEGADPSADEAGFSALHLAIMRRDEGLLRTLLAHGADPNARIATWTPTRRASRDWHFHPSVIGATPFWLAARFSEPGMMRLLAEHGADPLFVHEVHYVGNAGTFGAGGIDETTTTLMAAVGMGGPRRMRAFMPPNPDELEAKALAAVEIAVELGVDVGATDLEGQTATDRAGFPSVRDFLVSAEADQP